MTPEWFPPEGVATRYTLGLVTTDDPSDQSQNGLTHAAAQAREWTARRDELIRAAFAGGWSYRAIGEKVGLSHSAVAKIVKRPARALEI